MRKRTLVLPPSLISNCRHRILSGRQICSRAQDRRTAIVKPVMTAIRTPQRGANRRFEKGHSDPLHLKSKISLSTGNCGQVLREYL